MRISDWSSDVCSSDLIVLVVIVHVVEVVEIGVGFVVAGAAGRRRRHRASLVVAQLPALAFAHEKIAGDQILALDPLEAGDRKGVVWGKRVSVRLDLGGRRNIKTKNDLYPSKID